MTVSEFLRMGTAGVFAPDDRLELIEGEILDMARIGSPHAGTVNAMNSAFVARAGGRYIVSVQNPVALDEWSLPQPDLALLKWREDAYRASHPTPESVLLIVEVADTTLDFDLGLKARLYARVGIAELWVADLARQAVHVCRGPSKQGYAFVTVRKAPDVLRPLAVPDVELLMAMLFPETD